MKSTMHRMKISVSLGLVLCSMAVLPGESAADDKLAAEEYLFYGQRLAASGCVYSMNMQSDGNLVIPGTGWASNTAGLGGYAVMQGDGNLVIYNWADAPVWASNTFGNNFLAMQNDRNAVVYQTGGGPLWASNTVAPEPIGTTNCTMRSITTEIDHGYDRPGGDYVSYPLNEARPSHCAYFCSQDSACRAFTYVPPGVQGPNAVCWLKSSVPGLVPAPGMSSGRIVRDGYCAHDPCVTGEPLDPYCKYARQICDVDPYCCNVAWDSICVEEVRTVAGRLVCEESKGTCAHTLCTEGAKLSAGCDSPPAPSSCVSKICAADPYCCMVAWDDQCKSEVYSECWKECLWEPMW